METKYYSATDACVPLPNMEMKINELEKTIKEKDQEISKLKDVIADGLECFPSYYLMGEWASKAREVLI